MSINVAAIPSPFIHATIKRRKNTWYTIASGNWSDPNIWMSNSRRRYSSPQTGDDVSIGLGHTVTFDTAGTTTTNVNNFYVAGTFLTNTANKTLNVLGDLQASGTVDLTSTGTTVIRLYGVNNIINNFICGANSGVTYGRFGDQPIMDLTYRHLGIENTGTKYLTANMSLLGNLNIQGVSPSTTTAGGAPTFELSTYNLTVNGTTAMQGQATANNAQGVISKTGSGNILFVGNVSVNSLGGILFTGNPTVEFRGGFTWSSATVIFNSGTSLWSVTTNTQTFTVNTSTLPFTCPLSVVGAIDLTVAGTGIMQLNQPIDHTVAGRTTTNKGTIYFNSTSSLPSFTTGTFDRTSFANTVGYTMGASITLPYTSYYSLAIGGTGVKSPTASLSLPGSLTIISGGSFQMSTYDLTVTGTTSNSGTLSKSASGTVLLIGAVTFGVNSTMDLTGNPDVEIRGGLSVGSNVTYNGSVTLTLTTNNQSLSPISSTSPLGYNVLISGAITVTSTASNLSLVVVGTINGNNAASTFDNRITGTGSLQYQNTQQPMLTGVLQTNLAANTFLYNAAGNQDVKGTNYRTLTLAGSGIKTLQGNVVVATLYTLTPPATLNTNGFTRT